MCVYIYKTHAKEDHIHTLKILESMSEFDGNTKITLHALTVLESFIMLKLNTTQKKKNELAHIIICMLRLVDLSKGNQIETI